MAEVEGVRQRPSGAATDDEAQAPLPGDPGSRSPSEPGSPTEAGPGAPGERRAIMQQGNGLSFGFALVYRVPVGPSLRLRDQSRISPNALSFGRTQERKKRHNYRPNICQRSLRRLLGRG